MKPISYLLAVAFGALTGLNGQDDPARTVASYEPYAQIEFAQSMAWSPDDRHIIYTNGNQAGARLHIVSNGGTPRPFLGNLTVEVGAVWSPDGTRVAFISYRGGARGHIWTSDSSGGDLCQVTPFSLNGPASRLVGRWTSERARAAADRVMGGPPEQNPEAYRAASPIHFAERIKTPLLILHGAADQMAPYHHWCKPESG